MREEQPQIKMEMLPCLLSCFKQNPLVKKTTCQNNVITAEIGYVLLLQHYNRLPLVGEKSRSTHCTQALNQTSGEGKKQRGARM